MFGDIISIKNNDSQLIMIGNNKLINKTEGAFNSTAIQALIGKAIQKKFLSFDY